MEFATHRIEFLIHEDPNSSRRRVLVPYVDGQDIRELIRPAAASGGAGARAASFGGIPLVSSLDLRRQYMGHPTADSFEGAITILGCSCGIVDCGPFKFDITVDEDLVTWYDVRQPPKGRSYDLLGPFRFDRREYVSGLSHVQDVLAREGILGWKAKARRPVLG